MNGLSQIREEEIARRKQGNKTNINTPEMQDLRWRSYGKSRKQLMPAMQEMYDYIVSKVDIGKFLDVGCGEASIIRRVDQKCSCSELWGIDISPTRLFWNMQKVREWRLERRIFFLFSYAENLVFEDEYFDYIACTATIEHITEPKKAISEIMRVLKVGGKAYFGIPIEANPDQHLRSPDHYHFWKSEEAILKLFDGLKVIETKYINPNLVVCIKKEVK